MYQLGCTAWICVKFGIAKLLKSAKKIQVWLKSDKNIGHFT